MPVIAFDRSLDGLVILYIYHSMDCTVYAGASELRINFL